MSDKIDEVLLRIQFRTAEHIEKPAIHGVSRNDPIRKLETIEEVSAEIYKRCFSVDNEGGPLGKMASYMRGGDGKMQWREVNTNPYDPEQRAFDAYLNEEPTHGIIGISLWS